MAKRMFACCAISILLLAGIVPFLPQLVQFLFWYVHQAPSGQTRHTAKFPPDIGDNLVRGIPTNPTITDRRMDFLENNFTHRAGDVWVITYQKVGTTWTQYIVSLLLGNARETSLFDLWTTCPWPEMDIGLIATSPESLQSSANNAKRPRCFKSHWPRKGFFTQLPQTSKIIYVLRDAESVALSYWNHIFNYVAFYRLREGDMTWDQYFEKWYHGDLQNGGYFEHVASWWEARHQNNIMFLRYEDLAGDTVGSIRGIATFLGTQIDDAKVADIVDATSKDNMRKWNEGAMDHFMISMGVMKGDHIRKDGSKKTMPCSEDQRLKMVSKYEALLKPLDMPFEYMFRQQKNQKH